MLTMVPTAALCRLSSRMSKQIQSSQSACAAILGDGSVVTWGAAECGADSSTVQI